MFDLKIDTNDLRTAVDILADTGKAFSFNEIEQDIEKIISETNKSQFESLGARSGSKWEDLKESTVKDKVRKGFQSKQILERTGKLKESLINPQITTENSGKIINVKFSGDHAFLIPIQGRTRKLISLTTADFNAIGILVLDKFVSNFSHRLKLKRKR